MAQAAAKTSEMLGIRNIDIIAGDGGDAQVPAAPYDRAIFLAGAYDLARPFDEQMADGGLLLAVLKSEGDGDNLFLLRKTAEHFASLEAMPCGFVQLRGRARIEGMPALSSRRRPDACDTAARSELRSERAPVAKSLKSERSVPRWLGTLRATLPSQSLALVVACGMHYAADAARRGRVDRPWGSVQPRGRSSKTRFRARGGPESNGGRATKTSRATRSTGIVTATTTIDGEPTHRL
jgi:protein-L-isoaspartate(D-aspartate) O-methyltransferase (PCMT)